MIRELLDKDYKVIFSNYDAWYLDCGYAGWVTDGNNWCSPWKGWQAVYDNSPRQMYRDQGGERSKGQLFRTANIQNQISIENYDINNFIH